jgi:hypothetical protein
MHKSITFADTAKGTRNFSPKEVYRYWREVLTPSMRKVSITIKAKVNQASDAGEKNVVLPMGTMKAILVQLDRVGAAAEIMAEALDMERAYQEQHPEAIREALELDAVPFAEYASLAADYVRISKALDTAQKNMEAINDAWQHAAATDNLIIETLLKSRKNGN